MDGFDSEKEALRISQPAEVPHEKLRRLYDLWAGKREGRHMPARRDFDTLELAPWFGHLHMVEVEGRCEEFRYRVYGSEIAAIFRVDLTGKRPEATAPTEPGKSRSATN